MEFTGHTADNFGRQQDDESHGIHAECLLVGGKDWKALLRRFMALELIIEVVGGMASNIDGYSDPSGGW